MLVFIKNYKTIVLNLGKLGGNLLTKKRCQWNCKLLFTVTKLPTKVPLRRDK